MDWNSSQIVSPRESMHSELLLHLNRSDLKLSERSSKPQYEVAVWLILKNTEQLPSLLLMEFRDRNGTYWKILDTVTARTNPATVLLSGVANPDVRHIKEIDIFLCHPNPFLQCRIDELRFNNRLQKTDFLITFNVA